jgi:hypothetical protein
VTTARLRAIAAALIREGHVDNAVDAYLTAARLVAGERLDELQRA